MKIPASMLPNVMIENTKEGSMRRWFQKWDKEPGLVGDWEANRSGADRRINIIVGEIEIVIEPGLKEPLSR